MPINRAQWRALKGMSTQEGLEFLGNLVDDESKRVREYAYYDAWTSMMLALADRYPLTAAELHSIAVDTLEYTNGVQTPAELALVLKERTGFDVREKPADSELEYIPSKGKGREQDG